MRSYCPGKPLPLKGKSQFSFHVTCTYSQVAHNHSDRVVYSDTALPRPPYLGSPSAKRKSQEVCDPSKETSKFVNDFVPPCGCRGGETHKGAHMYYRRVGPPMHYLRVSCVLANHNDLNAAYFPARVVGGSTLSDILDKP